MLHLGDVSKIRGCVVAPVDVVIGGSPCQDLSIAGKRAGLGGQRSGLFMEQIRIIKEMRHRYGANHPRWMVWENVPGAFSSNGGEDFRIVLEETARIAEPDAAVPRPPKGKWTNAGCIMGDGWSLAWRVHDAQFWGVPQRRRRIALVADFGGRAAPEILFERKGLCWYPAEGGEAGETAAGAVEDGAYPAVARSLTARYDGSPCADRGPNIVCMATQQGGAEIRTDDKAPTLTAAAGMSGNNQPVIYREMSLDAALTMRVRCGCEGGGKGALIQAEKSGTLACNNDQVLFCSTPMVMASSRQKAEIFEDKSPTIMAGNERPIVAAVDCRNGRENECVNGTLQAKTSGGYSINNQNTVRQGNVVRRLTPLECERLQGYPDGYTDIGEWTDSKGKTHQTSDAARYKALGNSIALPFWLWLTKRISAQYERDATMASLFDGLGGFPLVWERVNGKGSCKWASEVDEFCIAVTKKRFN